MPNLLPRHRLRAAVSLTAIVIACRTPRPEDIPVPPRPDTASVPAADSGGRPRADSAARPPLDTTAARADTGRPPNDSAAHPRPDTTARSRTESIETSPRPSPADSAHARDSVLALVPPATTAVPHSKSKKKKRRIAPTDSAATEGTAPPVWPVTPPPPLPGSILPARRIVAFYGNPYSKRMGVLGALPPDQMLAKLDREVEAWKSADPATPVQPALQLIAVVAQGGPGRDGKYRMRMPDTVIDRVASWAARRDALLFLDIQVGKSTLQAELPRLIPYLKRPNVHLGIDPEFSMKDDHVPGTRIGTFDARDVNYAVALLDSLVVADSLPPKVLVVHRFTRDMLTGEKDIRLDARVQIVIDMDGWGPPSLKRGSYRAYIDRRPVEYTGFKLFYHNDTKHGDRLMTPAEVLRLFPKPLYIQYQ